MPRLRKLRRGTGLSVVARPRWQPHAGIAVTRAGCHCDPLPGFVPSNFVRRSFSEGGSTSRPTKPVIQSEVQRSVESGFGPGSSAPLGTCHMNSTHQMALLHDGGIVIGSGVEGDSSTHRPERSRRLEPSLSVYWFIREASLPITHQPWFAVALTKVDQPINPRPPKLQRRRINHLILRSLSEGGSP